MKLCVIQCHSYCVKLNTFLTNDKQVIARHPHVIRYYFHCFSYFAVIYRDLLRIHSDIYYGAFFTKTVNG